MASTRLDDRASSPSARRVPAPGRICARYAACCAARPASTCCTCPMRRAVRRSTSSPTTFRDERAGDPAACEGGGSSTCSTSTTASAARLSGHPDADRARLCQCRRADLVQPVGADGNAEGDPGSGSMPRSSSKPKRRRSKEKLRLAGAAPVIQTIDELVAFREADSKQMARADQDGADHRSSNARVAARGWRIGPAFTLIGVIPAPSGRGIFMLPRFTRGAAAAGSSQPADRGRSPIALLGWPPDQRSAVAGPGCDEHGRSKPRQGAPVVSTGF